MASPMGGIHLSFETPETRPEDWVQQIWSGISDTIKHYENPIVRKMFPTVMMLKNVPQPSYTYVPSLISLDNQRRNTNILRTWPIKSCTYVYQSRCRRQVLLGKCCSYQQLQQKHHKVKLKSPWPFWGNHIL